MCRIADCLSLLCWPGAGEQSSSCIQWQGGLGLVTARLPDWISEHYTACTLVRLLGGGGGGPLLGPAVAALSTWAGLGPGHYTGDHR